MEVAVVGHYCAFIDLRRFSFSEKYKDWIDAVDVVRFKKVYDVENNKFVSEEQVIIIDNTDYVLSMYPKMI